MSRGPNPAGGVGTAPPVSAEPPAPWPDLSDEEKAQFDRLLQRLNEAGGASKTHEDAINLCARALNMQAELSVVIREEGTTYETRNKDGETIIKARPEFAQRSEAMKQVARLLIELGLTPAARSRVKAGPKSGGKAAGAFSDF